MKFVRTSMLFGIAATTSFLSLFGCGGGSDFASPAYSVGGTVSGLATTQNVQLTINGGATVTINQNGTYQFADNLPLDSSYTITVLQQPTGAVCTVANNTGAGLSNNIDNVNVSCAATTHTVSGTVAGLAGGTSVALVDNMSDSLSVNANGVFTFGTPINDNGSYSVTVAAQPTGEVCTVGNSSAVGVTSNVSNVTVTCQAQTFPVSVTVSGLASGAQTTLMNNSADPLVVTGNGISTFAVPISYGSGYAVTVNQQPAGEICTVIQGSATNVVASITNIVVNCVFGPYTVGGTVSGLPSGQQVVLTNDGTDTLTIGADGSFTFATSLGTNTGYLVKVATQPSGASCVVNNNSGQTSTSNISNVAVTCSTSSNILSLLRFSQSQVADAQWNVSACTTTNTCVINSDTPGSAYVTPFSSGHLNFSGCGSGAYIVFDENIVSGVQDTTNPWAENLYRSDGTLCQAGGTGHFVAAGRNAQGNAYLFYVGSDNNTGTLVSPQSQLTGAGFSFTGVNHPTLAQITQYLQ